MIINQLEAWPLLIVLCSSLNLRRSFPHDSMCFNEVVKNIYGKYGTNRHVSTHRNKFTLEINCMAPPHCFPELWINTTPSYLHMSSFTLLRTSLKNYFYFLHVRFSHELSTKDWWGFFFFSMRYRSCYSSHVHSAHTQISLTLSGKQSRVCTPGHFHASLPLADSRRSCHTLNLCRTTGNTKNMKENEKRDRWKTK